MISQLANGRGDFAKGSGDFARGTGDFAKWSGELAKSSLELATAHGDLTSARPHLARRADARCRASGGKPGRRSYRGLKGAGGIKGGCPL